MKMSRRTAVVAGSIATLAVAGTLVAGPAFAKGHGNRTNQMSNSQGASGNVIGRMGGMGMSDSATVGGMMGGRGHGMRDMDGDHGMPNGVARGQMLHSEGVVAKTDSAGAVTYVTVREQNGKVTAASDSSITVKSDDGYTATWPISTTTIINRNGAVAKGSAFVAGDVVEVRGTVSSAGVVTTDSIHNHAPRIAPTPVVTPSASASSTTA